MKNKLLIVPVEKISTNPHQPRSESQFDPDKLAELADSIRSVGLLQPPIVRALSEDLYELIAGERRFRASKLAGLREIPVYVLPQDGLKSALSALIENIQRENLNPIDTATALKKLSEDFDLSQEEMASRLGMNRATLANQIRLLALPKMIREGLSSRLITQGHAKALLSLSKESEQIALFQVILQKNLSVRETELKVVERKEKSNSKQLNSKKKRNIFLQQIQERLQEKLGTKVTFSGTEREGVLSLHYYNLSDLNRLLNEIGYSEESKHAEF